MRQLTDRAAPAITAAVAATVYLRALWNGWAGDDLLVLLSNPTVKSVGGAFSAWFAPYWPGDSRVLGLHRPFTILTYAVDWSLLGGALWWFHLTNVLLHVIACVLVFWLARGWLSSAASMVAALAFAVHPVHVEAVANVVGRAELLAAVGLLGAMLAARRMRSAASPRGAFAWGGASVGLVAMALLPKEHAVVAIALLVVDHALAPGGAFRERALARSVRCYAGVLGVTAAWLFVWRGVVGGYVGSGAHEALADLSVTERLATMLPVSLEVFRLLTWPLRLASDYAPWVTTIRVAWSWPATVAVVTILALSAVVLVGYRRWPALSAGVIVGALSLAPTSNVVFVSGVVLAERTLYLAVLAPALALAVAWAALRDKVRPMGTVVVAGYLLLLSATMVERIPVWRDEVSLLAEARVSLPTSYRVRHALSAFYSAAGDSARALDERIAAYELFPEHPRGGLYVAELAYEMGHYDLALHYLEINRAARPDDAMVLEWEVLTLTALGRADSAVAVARRALDHAGTRVVLLGAYRLALDSAHAPGWIRTSAEAQNLALQGDFMGASFEIESMLAHPTFQFEPSGGECWELERAVPLVEALRPDALAKVRDRLVAWECQT